MGGKKTFAANATETSCSASADIEILFSEIRDYGSHEQSHLWAKLEMRQVSMDFLGLNT